MCGKCTGKAGGNGQYSGAGGGVSHPGQERRLPDVATHSRPWRRLPRSRAIDSGRRQPRVHSGKVKRLRVASVGAFDGGQAGRPKSRRILRDLPDTVKG